MTLICVFNLEYLSIFYIKYFHVCNNMTGQLLLLLLLLSSHKIKIVQFDLNDSFLPESKLFRL